MYSTVLYLLGSPEKSSLGAKKGGFAIECRFFGVSIMDTSETSHKMKCGQGSGYQMAWLHMGMLLVHNDVF